jgi:hypothetical protein
VAELTSLGFEVIIEADATKYGRTSGVPPFQLPIVIPADFENN